MPQIFISYRRADSQIVTGRIYDQLELAFGADSIFKDVDNIPAGEDFREVLREAVAWCQVMLVIIGPEWLSAHGPDGSRRLDDPADFVRLEIRSGLERQELIVIPVLVMDASMPAADRLPIPLRELAFLNAVEVRNDPDFRRDMQKLISRLQEIDDEQKAIAVSSKARPASRRNFILGGLLIVLVTLVVAGIVLLGGDDGDTNPTAAADSSSPAPSATPTDSQSPSDLAATIEGAQTGTAQSILTQTAEFDASLSPVVTFVDVDMTASAEAIANATATQGAIDAANTQQAEDNAVATQDAQNAIASQEAVNATVAALALTQTEAARPTITPTHTPTFTATVTRTITPSPTNTPAPTRPVGTSDLILYYDSGTGTSILGQLTDAGEYIDVSAPFTLPAGYRNVVGAGNSRQALFYNPTTGTGETVQFATDGTWERQWITDTFSRWTHVVENNGRILFYYSGQSERVNGVLTTLGRDGTLITLGRAFTTNTLRTGWSAIAGTNDWYIFYDKDTGNYEIMQINADATTNSMGLNSSGGFDTGWTHIVGYNGQLVFYNSDTGSAAYGTFTNGRFEQIRGYSAGSQFSVGWTNIVAIDDRLLFYNSANRTAEIGRFNSDGSYTALDPNLGMSGWTSITVLR